jgi:nucleoside-diphosphate-sugar epimerase
MNLSKQSAPGQKIILVTGGAGYIGSHVTARLLKSGYKVRVLDNLTYGDSGVKPFVKNRNYEFIEGNICHIEDMIKAMRGVYAAIDLAAIVGDPACEKDTEKATVINYEATKVLIEIAKHCGINRFLFASTCSVYGKNTAVVTEKSRPNPLSLYSALKLKSEEIILKNCGSVSPTIFRLATVYGASSRMRFDLVLNIMTAKAVCENTIRVFGGEQWRPLIHAQDVAKGFCLALESPLSKIKGQVFNLGSGEQNYKVIDIARSIKSILPKTEIQYDRENSDKRDYKVSFDKARKILKFSPSCTLRDGVTGIERLFREKKIKDFKNDIYYNVNYLFKNI